ncbi:MAG: 2-oxoacid:acceptor oxidoreductase family protein, partial [Candidatus Omnitrophota bacterium]
LLVLNTSLISRFPSRKDIEVLEIPATDTADKLGSTKVANMVCLGAYCAKKKLSSLEKLTSSLRDFISEDKKPLLKINEDALRAGYELVK